MFYKKLIELGSAKLRQCTAYFTEALMQSFHLLFEEQRLFWIYVWLYILFAIGFTSHAYCSEYAVHDGQYKCSIVSL